MSGDITIALDGATYAGSVALLRGSEVVAARSLEHSADKPAQRSGDRLMPAVAAAMTEAGVRREHVLRIVCGAGPGSFTSLRVAGSIAKGLAAGYGVPLFAVNSLLLTVAGSKRSLRPGAYLSLLDAMRGEYFALRVTIGGNGAIETPGGGTVGIIAREEVSRLAEADGTVKRIGPAQEIDEIPHARGVARLLDEILASGAVDLASWEPDYGRLAEAQVRWEAEHGRPLRA